MLAMFVIGVVIGLIVGCKATWKLAAYIIGGEAVRKLLK